MSPRTWGPGLGFWIGRAFPGMKTGAENKVLKINSFWKVEQKTHFNYDSYSYRKSLI